MSIDITLQTNVYLDCLNWPKAMCHQCFENKIYQEMKSTGKHLSTMIFTEEANLNWNLKMFNLVFQE